MSFEFGNYRDENLICSWRFISIGDKSEEGELEEKESETSNLLGIGSEMLRKVGKEETKRKTPCRIERVYHMVHIVHNMSFFFGLEG